METVRLAETDLHPGTIFFAFFDEDYYVHQRYSFVILVRNMLLPA